MQRKEELIIIRHARSQHNMGETDDLDCGITEFGIRQANNVGKFLQHQFFSGKFDIKDWNIYTSPFLRCLQTTDHIFSQLSSIKKPIVCPSLREYLNHSGNFVDIPIRHTYDFDWSSFPNDRMEFVSEQNETFLERIHNAHDVIGNRSIVVTHGLPACALKHVAAYNANYVPVWDNSIDNCSITWLRNGRVVWHGRNLYNEVEYDPENYRRCFVLEP